MLTIGTDGSQPNTEDPALQLRRAGLSYRRIAEALGSSTSTVRRQVLNLDRASSTQRPAPSGLARHHHGRGRQGAPGVVERVDPSHSGHRYERGLAELSRFAGHYVRQLVLRPGEFRPVQRPFWYE